MARLSPDIQEPTTQPPSAVSWSESPSPTSHTIVVPQVTIQSRSPVDPPADCDAANSAWAQAAKDVEMIDDPVPQPGFHPDSSPSADDSTLVPIKMESKPGSPLSPTSDNRSTSQESDSEAEHVTKPPASISKGVNSNQHYSQPPLPQEGIDQDLDQELGRAILASQSDAGAPMAESSAGSGSQELNTANQEDVMLNGFVFKRWDLVLGKLPPWVICPNHLSQHFPHHLIGMLGSFRDEDNWIRADTVMRRNLQITRESYLDTLARIFKLHRQLALDVSSQIVTALDTTGSRRQPYIFNVLPQILLSLKKNYLTEVAQCFWMTMPISMEEAITDAIFMAATDNFFELEFIKYNEMWATSVVDFRPAIPKAQQNEQNHRFTFHGFEFDEPLPEELTNWRSPVMMFLDGFGRGISEAEVQAGTAIAGHMQALAASTPQHRTLNIDFEKQHNLCSALVDTLPKPTIPDNDTEHRQAMSHLGWTAQSGTRYTTWRLGSIFSCGEFWDQSLFAKGVFQVDTIKAEFHRASIPWVKEWGSRGRSLNSLVCKLVDGMREKYTPPTPQPRTASPSNTPPLGAVVLPATLSAASEQGSQLNPPAIQQEEEIIEPQDSKPVEGTNPNMSQIIQDTIHSVANTETVALHLTDEHASVPKPTNNQVLASFVDDGLSLVPAPVNDPDDPDNVVNAGNKRKQLDNAGGTEQKKPRVTDADEWDIMDCLGED
ncbi:hypothetical protein FRC06_000693 [Ceratobasidium sp. 370]|nr:hypothetical protein FRC06_000693 [Ceratobasidium sp. 370]